MAFIASGNSPVLAGSAGEGRSMTGRRSAGRKKICRCARINMMPYPEDVLCMCSIVAIAAVGRWNAVALVASGRFHVSVGAGKRRAVAVNISARNNKISRGARITIMLYP